MSRNLIIASVVIIVVIGGVVLLAGQQNNQKTTSTPISTEALQEEPSPTEVMQKEEVEMEPDGETASEVSIDIANFAYSPRTLTIKQDTTVTWTNQDSVAHTATADDGSFDTGSLARGESGSITFQNSGTYTYHCTPHPNMKATIIVE